VRAHGITRKERCGAQTVVKSKQSAAETSLSGKHNQVETGPCRCVCRCVLFLEDQVKAIKAQLDKTSAHLPTSAGGASPRG
jgi:hypothetical protein